MDYHSGSSDDVDCQIVGGDDMDAYVDCRLGITLLTSHTDWTTIKYYFNVQNWLL